MVSIIKSDSISKTKQDIKNMYFIKISKIFREIFIKYLNSLNYTFDVLVEGCFIVYNKKPKNPLIQQIYKINVLNTKQKITTIFIINFILKEVKKQINKKIPFKLRCNIFGERTFNVNILNSKSRDLDIKIGRKLNALGFKIDLNNFKYIFVINIFKRKILISKLTSKIYYRNYFFELNTNDKNINYFQINRSQLKLRQALIYFNVDLTQVKTSLDLGASPGGFSKELSNHNINIIAIDPANLDKRLNNNKNIKHLKMKVNEFKTNKKFDLIVNDMNMHPIESANTMINLSKFLKNNKLAIMTIKCPSMNVFKYIKQSKQILKKQYEKFEIQHLPNNRKEITIKMIKK